MKLSRSIKSEINEADLLLRAMEQNDNEASGTLFVHYTELIYGVCLKYLRDPQEAEDTLMELYEIFLKKVKEHEIKNLKSWLYVLTKNHCLGILRKKRGIWKNLIRWQLCILEKTIIL